MAERPILGISVRELSRDTCAVLARLRRWERVIVTRHGHPVAVLLAVPDCIELLAGEPLRGRAGNMSMRRELLEHLLGPDLHQLVADREVERNHHGRRPRSVWE